MLAVASSQQGLDALPAGTDWEAVGLVLAVVGAFLLANAILFQHPRAMVEQHFEAGRRPLLSIRGFIFQRVNVRLGFLFLLTGFGLQLYGHLRPAVASEFPTGGVGAALLAAVVLELAGWLWSHRLFRRYVRSYLRAHPVELDTDPRLARELGELFGIPQHAEDTVQSYVARLRARVEIPDTLRTGRSGSKGGGSSTQTPVEVAREGRG